jgi:hypothetical protein
MSRMTRLVPALALVALGCQTSGGNGSAVASNAPPPSSKDWQGVYQGPYHIFLRIETNGEHAGGTWRAAGNRTGELEGVLDGNVLRYTWTENAGPESSWSGRGYFVYRATGATPELEGEWGIGSLDYGNPTFAVKRTDLKISANGSALLDQGARPEDAEAPDDDRGEVCATCGDEFTSDE